MDIAQIRKKAKGRQPGRRDTDVSAPAVPATVAPDRSGDGAASSLSSGENLSLPLAASQTNPVPADSASALDRLFSSGDGTYYANEEIYQTALAVQNLQEERELIQLLAFQLGSEEYALDINQISEIIKPREYTDIPRVPDFILGLVSLRGVVVPIFDLRQRFQMGKVELSSAARIIVCRDGDIMAGLLVDKINQVVKIAVDKIEPPPAVISGIDRNMISGIGRSQGRMIILLNLAVVLEILPG